MDSRRHPDGLAVAAQALSAAKVSWCVLRDAAPGADRIVELDVLVDPADAEAAGAALVGAGFVHLAAWGRAPHRFYVAPGSATPWVKIDVVTELSYGLHHQLVTDLAPAILERSQPDGCWRRLDPEDQFATLLFHALLDRRELRPSDRSILKAWAEKAGTGGPLGGRAPARQWTDLVTAVTDGRWDEVSRARPLLRRALTRGTRGRVVRRWATNRVGRRLARPLAALRRPGLTVALLGPDGSGKSAVAEAVARTSYGPVRVLYGGLHPRWARQLRAPGATTIAKVLRLWGVGAAAGWHRRRGRLVIFDRHPVEGRRPLSRPMALRGRFRRRVLAGVLPAPGAVVVLDAPAEVLRRRKQENPFDQLANDRLSYLALAETLDDATVVDATGDIDDVGRLISTLAWNRAAGAAR